MGRPVISLIGQKFNKLEVISFNGTDKGNNAMWLCKCDCGNETIVSSGGLKKNEIKSCGCFRKEYMATKQQTHNLSKTRIYGCWRGMIRRCSYKNTRQKELYFARGIKVCDKWLHFEGFYEDMKDSYSEKLSLDRINNDKGYYKDNCRWATMATQGNNRSTNLYFTVDGITDTLANTARRYGTTGKLAHRRIKAGWEINKAFKTPSHHLSH